VDLWLLESAHGGLLTDRLLIAGSDDPLLYRLVLRVANEIQARGLISYTATGTQLGLSLLARRRADVCGIHWGPAEESRQRHPALLKQYALHRDWVLVRLFLREQGLILAPGTAPSGGELSQLFGPEARWVSRQEGAGSQRFLQEIISRHGLNPAARRVAIQAYSERDAAAMIAMGMADVGTGIRAAAAEFGLDFVPIGWEAFDFAMPRGIFFRTMFQKLLEQLRGPECQRLGQMLGGYDFTDSGQIIWPV
jgi:molybdate-binding protein